MDNQQSGKNHNQKAQSRRLKITYACTIRTALVILREMSLFRIAMQNCVASPASARDSTLLAYLDRIVKGTLCKASRAIAQPIFVSARGASVQHMRGTKRCGRNALITKLTWSKKLNRTIYHQQARTTSKKNSFLQQSFLMANLIIPALMMEL